MENIKIIKMKGKQVNRGLRINMVRFEYEFTLMAILIAVFFFIFTFLGWLMRFDEMTIEESVRSISIINIKNYITLIVLMAYFFYVNRIKTLFND